MHRLVVVVTLLAAVACSDSSPTAPAPPLRQQVILAPGQSSAVQGSAFVVRFDGVEGDSRCPADALCILGGSATVKMTMLTATSAQAYTIETGDMRPFVYEDVTVSLVQLDPYPFSSLPPIEPGDYRATLLLTR